MSFRFLHGAPFAGMAADQPDGAPHIFLAGECDESGRRSIHKVNVWIVGYDFSGQGSQFCIPVSTLGLILILSLHPAETPGSG